MDERRFSLALSRFDEEHAADPARVTVDGVQTPAELLYARRMSARLEALVPDASEALRLAVHAQHLRRFDVPRDRYPMDRAGYHRWRADLGKMHATLAGRLLLEVGYEQHVVDRVESLIRKKDRQRDEESQALEDVACLVFLEHAFESFAAKHEDDKLIEILRKTWAKMSEQGRDAARRVPLSQRATRLLADALG